MNAQIIEPELIGVVDSLLLGKPSSKSLVLECTDLPPYAHAL